VPTTWGRPYRENQESDRTSLAQGGEGGRGRLNGEGEKKSLKKRGEKRGLFEGEGIPDGTSSGPLIPRKEPLEPRKSWGKAKERKGGKTFINIMQENRYKKLRQVTIENA